MLIPNVLVEGLGKRGMRYLRLPPQAIHPYRSWLRRIFPMWHPWTPKIMKRAMWFAWRCPLRAFVPKYHFGCHLGHPLSLIVMLLQLYVVPLNVGAERRSRT